MSEHTEKLPKPPIAEKARVITALESLAQECSEEGWDGSGAMPVDEAAVVNAIDFIRALPDNVPVPEAAAEPDGAISLDWIRSRNRVFSLSIDVQKRLAYAWLNDADKGHAVACFDGRTVPPYVLALIGEL